MDGIIDRLLEAAQTRPEAPALKGNFGQVPYAALMAGVRTQAARLHASGVRAGDTVALHLPDDSAPPQHQVEILYALIWLGAPVLPLFAAMPQEQCSALIQQSRARWLIAYAPFPNCNAQWLTLEKCDLARWTDSPAPRGDTPERGIWFEFTSGTTGTPKAVCMSHEQFAATRGNAALAYGWRNDDVVLAAQPWPAKVSLRTMLRTLWMGACFLDRPTPHTRAELTTLIDQFGLSCVDCLPLQLRNLMGSTASDAAPLPLRRMRIIGAAISPQELQAAREHLVRQLFVGYGSTELGLMAYLRPEDAPDGPYRVVQGLHVEALDDLGAALPAGSPGRLRFSAPWLPTCYALGTSRTSEGFQTNGFVSSDLGVVVAPGLLRVLGRADNVINVGGAKVAPQDVEQALLSHPDVADAAVVGVVDPRVGESVAAFLVLRTSLSVDTLRDYLFTRLESEQVPVVYVGLQRIPRNPEGKVLVQPLRELYAERKREFDARTNGTKQVEHNGDVGNGPIDRLLQWAQTRPDVLALRGPTGRLTYAALLSGLRARAAWLHSRGVGAGHTVALAFVAGHQTVREQVEWFYALVWLGATVLPLYPDIPENQYGSICDQLGASWWLHLAPPVETRARWLSPADYLATQWTGHSPPRGDTPERGFFYVFTSGTTGKPKAMCPSSTEFAAARRLAETTYGWHTDDVALPAQIWPSKVGVRSLMRTLWMGSSFLNLPFPQTRAELAGLIQEHQLSYLDCSPLQVRTLLASATPSGAASPLPLRLMSVIGAAISPQDIAAARHGLVRNLHIGYGSTEIHLMGHLGPDDPPEAPFHQIPGMQVQALDPQGQVLPDGLPGRLRFRADWLPTRYAVGDVLPHEGFHDGWFISSDMGAIVAPGRIRLLGRADDAINVGGTKVMPLDVEYMLLSHPDIADAAVVGVPDSRTGESVAAFLVPRRPIGVDPLRAWLAQRLSQPQVPVIYLGLDMIPRNPEGKVQAQLLRELYLQRKRDFDSAGAKPT